MMPCSMRTEPWGQGVLIKVQRLVFKWEKVAPGQIGSPDAAAHGDTADLRHGKLLCFEELTVLRRQRDRFVGHALFQHSHTMGIGCTAISRFPAISDTVRVFHNAGMFQHTTGCAPFLKKDEPYLSTAMEVPRLFFIMAIGEKPIRPLNPSPGT